MKRAGTKHVLAILRGIIGLGQKELAQLVNRSPRTIQAIEINRLRLSEELANRISVETGVAFGWLLGGNPEEKPYVTGGLGIEYTKEHYERNRGLIAAGQNPDVLGLVGEEKVKEVLGDKGFSKFKENILDFEGNWLDDFQSTIRTLFAALEAASRVGRYSIATYRLNQFVDEIKDSFGQAVDDLFFERYGALLRGLTEGVESSKALTRREGDILWSPYLPQERWKSDKISILDVMLPEGMDSAAVKKILDEHFEEVMSFGLAAIAERLQKTDKSSVGIVWNEMDVEAAEDLERLKRSST